MSGELAAEEPKRRAEQNVQFVADRESDEVMFIDENTPAPELPKRKPYVPVSRRRKDGNALYIGPE